MCISQGYWPLDLTDSDINSFKTSQYFLKRHQIKQEEKIINGCISNAVNRAIQKVRQDPQHILLWDLMQINECFKESST